MTLSTLTTEYIAQHGVRRFEQGTSSEYYALQAWLLQRGHVLTCASNRYTLKPVGQPGRGKGMTWGSVLNFIDSLRVAENLEPLRRKA